MCACTVLRILLLAFPPARASSAPFPVLCTMNTSYYPGPSSEDTTVQCYTTMASLSLHMGFEEHCPELVWAFMNPPFA